MPTETPCPTETKTQQRRGVWTHTIPGRYHPITVHGLAMAWWLYHEKHITRRQLRVFFAAHEMLEKRRYTKNATRPFYGLDELKALVGGRGNPASDAALAADLKRLAKLGLVVMNDHDLVIARSIDQINLEDIQGFWDFFEQLPNRRRSVPVPRRTLRALAGGFTGAVTGVMIAMLMRSLFWHKEQEAYRIDGRVKAAWIAETFGLSLSSVKAARNHLVDLGWLEPLEATQWQLNRYGQWFHLHVEAFGPQKGGGDAADTDAKSAPPPADISPNSAPPCLNRSSPSKEGNLKNSPPAHARSGPALLGRRKRERPTLRDIQVEDLRDTDRLLMLYDQAVSEELVMYSEAGRISFIALAERALAHGRDPARLFAHLLRKGKFEYITAIDEERASARLRVLYDGPDTRKQQGRGRDPSPVTAEVEWTEDELIVIACIKAAKGQRIEPFRIARICKGWDREQWDRALASYELKDRARWSESNGYDGLDSH